MSKVPFTSLIVLCAALAACADTNTTTPTAPQARAALNEAAADLSVGFSLDGEFGAPFGTVEASAQLAASVQRTTTGGRASGHVGFPTGVPAAGITSESYSFVALGTDAATLGAKGEYEFMLTSVAGNTNKVHGDVTCMNTFGNTTRVGGQITKIWRNGVQIPVPPTATHNIWVVVDNGEGNGNTDLVSLMRFSNAATAQFYCANGFSSVVFPNQEGNVQVKP